MKLCSDVEPMPFEQVEAVIDASFGYSWKDVFASIDKKPLGAASIAQVHRATLKTGEHVVVKVQRKGIHEVMSKDMALLHKAVKLVPPISIKGSPHLSHRRMSYRGQKTHALKSPPAYG